MASEAAEQSRNKRLALPLYQVILALSGIFVVSTSSAISTNYTSVKPPVQRKADVMHLFLKAISRKRNNRLPENSLDRAAEMKQVGKDCRLHTDSTSRKRHWSVRNPRVRPDRGLKCRPSPVGLLDRNPRTRDPRSPNQVSIRPSSDVPCLVFKRSSRSCYATESSQAS